MNTVMLDLFLDSLLDVAFAFAIFHLWIYAGFITISLINVKWLKGDDWDAKYEHFLFVFAICSGPFTLVFVLVVLFAVMLYRAELKLLRSAFDAFQNAKFHNVWKSMK